MDVRTTGLLLRNRAGTALTTLDARRMVNRIAKTAGCRHITPHGLRRTFCTAGLVSELLPFHNHPTRLSVHTRHCAEECHLACRKAR